MAPHVSSTHSYNSGDHESRRFSPSERRSLSWGSWHLCGCLLAEKPGAEPGMSLQTLTVFCLCSSSRSHAPPPRVPGILLSWALVRAEALGKEIDWGLAPSKAALLGPSMTYCPLPGRGGDGPCAGQQIRACRKRQLEFSVQPFALQNCGVLTHSKGRRVLNVSSEDLGTVPGSGAQFRKTVLNLILQEGPAQWEA